MVEWKRIGEIVRRNKGIPITAGQMSELNSPIGNVRVFAAGQTIADICENDLPADCAYKKPSIIVKSRGYIDFEFYDKPFTHKNEMWSYSFEDRKIGKFIYYYLTTKTEFFRKKAKANSVKLPQLCVADTDNYLVPVLSLSEQNRIVGILDTFTTSIENLKEQITQRRKQYEHYRDQLLDLKGKEGMEKKTLGEICTVITGGEVPEDTIKGQLSPTTEYPYAVYTNGKETYGFTKSYQVENDAVCISSIGANTGAVFYKEGKFTPAIRLKVLIPIQKLNTRFLYYAASKIDFRGKNTGSVPNINANYVKSKEIPVPSLFEQQRIVSILDTFEASIANLEAQLSQREKQYEYYRNKLVTFD